MLFTAAHELTHFIKDWSSVKYMALADALVKQYQKRGVSVSELVDNQIAKAKQNGREISRQEAFGEVVADSMESMLTDENAAAFLERLAQRDKGPKEKIVSWLRELAAKLKNALSAYKDVKPDSPEGKMVAEMEDFRKEIMGIYTSALVDAGESFRENGGNKKATREGDVKNSVRETDEGIKYVVLDGNLFVDKNGKPLSPKQAYNSLVGQIITLDDGDVITFVKNIPGIEMYKELFKKYPGYDGSFDIVGINWDINKNILDVVSGSMVQKRNEPQRHYHYGISDFDQRQVFITDGNEVYRLELNIANLTDGKKVVYVKRYIEKADYETAQKVKKAETAGKTRLNQPSGTSIRNPEQVVKKKLQMSDRDSDGRQISDGQREYFKDSVVRDDDGNLIPVYHSTHEEFYTFKRDKLGGETLVNANDASLAATSLVGHWFSDHDNSNRIGGHPLKCYLKITRPYRTDLDSLAAEIGSYSDDLEKMQEHFEMGQYNLVRKAASDFVRWLRFNGYDGLIVDDREFGGISYVVLNSRQAKLTTNENPTGRNDTRFSDRDPTAEATRAALEKENGKLREDVSRLRELLKLQGKVTGGTVMKPSSVEAAARWQNKYAGAKADVKELSRMLTEFYRFLATDKDYSWEDVHQRAMVIAKYLQDNVQIKPQMSDYARDVLRDIRGSKITLDENQRAEVEYQYGCVDAIKS